MVLDLAQKTYFLITGASRGIGRTMAMQVAAKLKAGSLVVLLARSEQGLGQTKASIEALGKALQVRTVSIDLATASAQQFQELLSNSLSGAGLQATDFERAFIVHNAGTLGDVAKRAIDASDIAEWNEHYQLNVFSVVSLNVQFFRVFAKVPKLVVNVTSKCAIEPFGSMAFYCSSRAAREMYFRVLASEQVEDDALVLNYSPGAIDTDMTMAVQENTINKELMKFFKEQRDTKTMLTTEQTTKRFLQVLEEQKFKSGDHVDYWDE